MTDTLLYPYGDPAVTGTIKMQATDFRVDEELGFEPDRAGEHLFLQIEKTGLSTHELIDRVAVDFKVQPRDIGYSGLKDKHAVTRQWLSLQLPGQVGRIPVPETCDYKILDQGWHHRKLRPGTHRRNRFDVTIRNVGAFPTRTQDQFELVAIKGMANYFGQQRFGRQQDNVRQALRAFGNERKARKLGRSKKSLYLSALRSHLFNQILSRRIGSGFWNEPVDGDVFMLAGSQSIFYAPISQDLIDRFEQQDISSTISLYGVGNQMLQGSALSLEDSVLAEFGVIKDCLLQQNIRLAMRATRVTVDNMNYDYSGADQTLKITAILPRGSYFTTLLNHFVMTEIPRADHSLR